MPVISEINPHVIYKLSFNPLNLLGGFLHLCFQTCDILCVLKYRVSIDRVIEYEFHRSRSYRTACKVI